MNNEQFRRLIAANTAKPSTDSNGASSTPSRGAALGSRQKSSIPMTPRSVAGLPKSDFARQLAERNQPEQKEKRVRSSAPKGSKLAQGYVDRTQARQSVADEEDDRAKRLKALEEALKEGEIDQATFDNLRSQIAGGDLSSTHLVKGLDFKLLERIRRGDDVYGDDDKPVEEEDEEEEIPDEVGDVDDELDRLEDEEVAVMTKEKATKKGHLSTAPTSASRKRTRDQILAEMKMARDAAKAKAEPALGDKFRKIGIKPPGTRIERDSQGREVMIIVDEDGNEKRKVRKTGPNKPSQDAHDLMMPDPKAKPLGMEVPDIYKPKAEESDEGDVNIFDDVDDDYDPLAGLGDNSDSDENEDNASAKELKATNADKATGEMMPPPRPIVASEPRNYFKDSKTGLVSAETVEAPSMSDPAIQAALKKAASLHAIAKASEDEEDEETRAKMERRRKMLENNDRDAEDMDMGFGTSRFEDDADLDEQRVKLSEWGRGGDDDDDGHKGGGGGSKRKRGPKKRKGDSNSAADVLREMERQRAAKQLA